VCVAREQKFSLSHHSFFFFFPIIQIQINKYIILIGTWSWIDSTRIENSISRTTTSGGGGGASCDGLIKLFQEKTYFDSECLID
jgi:hypothetical protein